jgi:hypothetical protein
MFAGGSTVTCAVGVEAPTAFCAVGVVAADAGAAVNVPRTTARTAARKARAQAGAWARRAVVVMDLSLAAPGPGAGLWEARVDDGGDDAAMTRAPPGR